MNDELMELDVEMLQYLDEYQAEAQREFELFMEAAHRELELAKNRE
jgi:hypothetical protein